MMGKESKRAGRQEKARRDAGCDHDHVYSTESGQEFLIEIGIL